MKNKYKPYLAYIVDTNDDGDRYEMPVGEYDTLSSALVNAKVASREQEGVYDWDWVVEKIDTHTGRSINRRSSICRGIQELYSVQAWDKYQSRYDD